MKKLLFALIALAHVQAQALPSFIAPGCELSMNLKKTNDTELKINEERGLIYMIVQNIMDKNFYTLSMKESTDRAANHIQIDYTPVVSNEETKYGRSVRCLVNIEITMFGKTETTMLMAATPADAYHPQPNVIWNACYDLIARHLESKLQVCPIKLK